MHAHHKEMAARAALSGDTTAQLNREELARIQSGNSNFVTRLISLPRSYYGMQLAHVGVAVFIAGVSVVTSYQTERDVKMTIWEHLDELRGRIVRAAIAVFTGTIVAWVFRVEILAWLIIPYQRVWIARFHKELLLQTLAPADAFLGYLEQSLTAGIIASAPVIFYQLWSFISPGLYKKEKRLIVPFGLTQTSYPQTEAMPDPWARGAAGRGADDLAKHRLYGRMAEWFNAAALKTEPLILRKPA